MVLLYTINNIFWLKRNLLVIPPPWDQAFYLYMSVRYLHALSDGGPLALFREFVHLNPQIAPLFPLTTVPLYLLFGMSRLVAHMTNAVYFSLLCLGVYLIGKRLYGRQTGLLAVLFMATFTAVVNFSRDYLLEFPAAALVTLGIYTLLRSEDLRHRPWCIGFGALVGLTLLTKTMAGVFFIGPSFYALGRSIRQRRFSVSVLANFLLSIGIAGVVASVWWGPNWRTALGYLIYYGFSAGSAPYRGGGSKIFALQNLGYYFLALINYGTSFFYALLFAYWRCQRASRGSFAAEGRQREKCRGNDKRDTYGYG
jgi:4-amino-4-deoxy-L-arabinose transferase-like glycosyltransferase